jgi:hypothetical protein
MDLLHEIPNETTPLHVSKHRISSFKIRSFFKPSANCHQICAEPDSTRLRVVDGLRCFAGAWILGAIVTQPLGEYGLFFRTVSNGGMGYSVFLLLSSFLACEYCFLEYRWTGGVNLARVCVRCFLRLWPGMLAFVCISALWVVLTASPDTLGTCLDSWVLALLFLSAVVDDSHCGPSTWLVSVVFIFGCMCPILVVFLSRLRSRWLQHAFLGGLMLVTLAVRAFVFFHDRDRLLQVIDPRLDPGVRLSLNQASVSHRLWMQLPELLLGALVALDFHNSHGAMSHSHAAADHDQSPASAVSDDDTSNVSPFFYYTHTSKAAVTHKRFSNHATSSSDADASADHKSPAPATLCKYVNATFRLRWNCWAALHLLEAVALILSLASLALIGELDWNDVPWACAGVQAGPELLLDACAWRTMAPFFFAALTGRLLLRLLESPSSFAARALSLRAMSALAGLVYPAFICLQPAHALGQEAINALFREGEGSITSPALPQDPAAWRLASGAYALTVTLSLAGGFLLSVFWLQPLAQLRLAELKWLQPEFNLKMARSMLTRDSQY